MQTAKFSTHHQSCRVEFLSSGWPSPAPTCNVPLRVSARRRLHDLEFDRRRARQLQVLRLQREAAVGFSDGRMRDSAQYDRHGGVAHGRVIDQPAHMDDHSLAVRHADSQQVLRARFYSPRRRRFRRRAASGAGQCECEDESEHRPRSQGRPRPQSKKPQTPMAVPAMLANTPRMGKKFLRAKKNKEHSTRPSSSKPSPMSKRRARFSSMSLSSSFRLRILLDFLRIRRVLGASRLHLLNGSSSFAASAPKAVQQGDRHLAGVFADLLGLVIGSMRRSTRSCG